MSTEKRYHYTYRITNVLLNKHYYGKRSSKVEPNLDLGIKYFSSSKDKEFINDQKDNPKNYKYKVIYIFDSAEKAINLEVKLQHKFDVGVNDRFYNRCKQTSTGFDFTGSSLTKEHKDKISKANSGKIMSEETKKLVGSYHKGKKLSYEHLRKLREGHKNFKHTEEHKSKLKDMYSGHKSSCSKPANIFCYETGKVIAENIVIGEWCKINNFNKSNLSKTANSDLSKPHHWKNNPRKTKGVYARYIYP